MRFSNVGRIECVQIVCDSFAFTTRNQKEFDGSCPRHRNHFRFTVAARRKAHQNVSTRLLLPYFSLYSFFVSIRFRLTHPLFADWFFGPHFKMGKLCSIATCHLVVIQWWMSAHRLGHQFIYILMLFISFKRWCRFFSTFAACHVLFRFCFAWRWEKILILLLQFFLIQSISSSFTSLAMFDHCARKIVNNKFSFCLFLDFLFYSLNQIVALNRFKCICINQKLYIDWSSSLPLLLYVKI